MMKCTIENIEKTTKKLLISSQEVSKAHKCDWQDEVHASYRTYVQACITSSGRAVEIATVLKASCDQLNSLKIDEDIKNAKSMIAEIGGI